MGIGIGIILIPSARKRVSTFMEKLNPELYNNLSNFINQLESAIEAGIEAANLADNKASSTDNLAKLEADEESPNYII